jgi:hypothetical protein
MEPPATGRYAAGHCAIEHEELLVHIPGSVAETYADRIDWHEVARLVHRGCPPRLALRIVR